MPIAAAAVIGVGGSIVSSLIGSHSAKTAATTLANATTQQAQIQADASTQALDFEKQQYADSQKLQQPYVDAGKGALQTINTLLPGGSAAPGAYPQWQAPAAFQAPNPYPTFRAPGSPPQRSGNAARTPPRFGSGSTGSGGRVGIGQFERNRQLQSPGAGFDPAATPRTDDHQLDSSIDNERLSATSAGDQAAIAQGGAGIAQQDDVAGLPQGGGVLPTNARAAGTEHNTGDLPADTTQTSADGGSNQAAIDERMKQIANGTVDSGKARAIGGDDSQGTSYLGGSKNFNEATGQYESSAGDNGFGVGGDDGHGHQVNGFGGQRVAQTDTQPFQSFDPKTPTLGAFVPKTAPLSSFNPKTAPMGAFTQKTPGYAAFQAPDQFKAPTADEAMSDPGAQARLDAVNKSLSRSAAINGNLGSGETLKAFAKLNQDFASNEYDKVYGRKLGEYQQSYNDALGQYQMGYGQNQDAIKQEETQYGINSNENQNEYNRELGTYGTNADTQTKNLQQEEAQYGINSQTNQDQYARERDQYNLGYAKDTDTYNRSLGEYQMGYNQDLNTYNQQLQQYQMGYNNNLNDYLMNYNQSQQQQTTDWNRLASVAGLGQQSAGQLSNTGLTVGNAVNNISLGNANAQSALIADRANANAAGGVGSSNAWSSAIPGISNSISALLAALNQNRGGGGQGVSMPGYPDIG